MAIRTSLLHRKSLLLSNGLRAFPERWFVLLILLVLVFAGLLFSSRLNATTVIAPSFDELVKQADVILQGTVTQVESAWAEDDSGRKIVTYVTVAVEEVIKGETATTYRLRMLGGTVGDRTLKVSDAPEFKVGDRDILFVQGNGRQFVPLVGIMHGRYRVQHESATGRDLIADNAGQAVMGLDRAGYVAASAAGAAGWSADDFKAAIRSRLNAK